MHLLPCSLALTRLTIGTKCSFSLVLSQTQIRRLSFWKPCCRLLPLSPGTHLISQSFSHSLSLSLFLTHSPTLAHTHIQSLPPSLSNLELPLSCRLFADSLSLSLSPSPALPLHRLSFPLSSALLLLQSEIANQRVQTSSSSSPSSSSSFVEVDVAAFSL